MEKPVEDIVEELIRNDQMIGLLQQLLNRGILNSSYAFRNYCLYSDYKKLLTLGMKKGKIYEYLSDKYCKDGQPISADRIEMIVLEYKHMDKIS